MQMLKKEISSENKAMSKDEEKVTSSETTKQLILAKKIGGADLLIKSETLSQNRAKEDFSSILSHGPKSTVINHDFFSCR